MSRSGQGLQPLEWLGLPWLGAVTATVLLATPVRLFGLALPEPVFPVLLAFSWAVIRPSIAGPFLLVAAGLFLDLFWSGQLGLWPTALLTAYGLAFAGRTLMVGQSTRVLAGWYLVVCLLAFSTAYLAAMLDSLTPPNLTATALQLAFTVALFPLARALIERFEDADIRFR